MMIQELVSTRRSTRAVASNVSMRYASVSCPVWGCSEICHGHSFYFHENFHANGGDAEQV